MCGGRGGGQRLDPPNEELSWNKKAAREKKAARAKEESTHPLLRHAPPHIGLDGHRRRELQSLGRRPRCLALAQLCTHWQKGGGLRV